MSKENVASVYDLGAAYKKYLNETRLTEQQGDGKTATDVFNGAEIGIEWSTSEEPENTVAAHPKAINLADVRHDRLRVIVLFGPATCTMFIEEFLVPQTAEHGGMHFHGISKSAVPQKVALAVQDKTAKWQRVEVTDAALRTAGFTACYAAVREKNKHGRWRNEMPIGWFCAGAKAYGGHAYLVREGAPTP